MPVERYLSPIYNSSLKMGYIQDLTAPQQEIKNLINQIPFKDNILLRYDNWTYHIRWFMLPAKVQRQREYLYNNLDTTVGITGQTADYKKTYNQVEELKKTQYTLPNGKKTTLEDFTESYGYDKDDIYHIPDNEKVILLETGITAQYNLESFNYKTVYSESSLNGHIHMTEMTMVVKEPLGCTLQDKWNVVSRALGWENNINMPYYVELYFEGYNPQTGMPEKITPTFLYKVVIENVATTINHTGTTYTIKMLPYYQYGFQKDNFLAQNLGKIGSLSAGNTLFEFTRDLEKRVNDMFFETGENKQLKTLYTDGQRYSFVIDKNISGAVLNNMSSFYRHYKSLLTQPKPNQTMQDILNNVWTQVADSKYDDTELKVFTKQVIIGYRPDGGQLEKIYYFIVPVRKPFLARYNTKFSTTNAKNYNTFGEYVNYLYTCGLINKRYDYLFTGKYIDVLNFDFKINNLWFLKTPREVQKTVENNKFDMPRDKLGNAIFDPLTYDGVLDARALQSSANEIYSQIYGEKNYTQVQKVKYLDDIEKYISPEEKFQYLNYKRVPIRADNNATVDEENQNDDAKPAIRETALEELHSAGEMATINFEIIGDPYWLGDDTFDNTLINIRNFVYGSHHIMFTVKTPVGQDNVTGEVTNYDASHTMTGFYIVNQIEHNFTASGKFTQRVKATIDPMLAIRSDYEDHKNIANQQTITSYNNERQTFTPINNRNNVTNNIEVQQTLIQQTPISAIRNWDIS